MSRWQLRDSPEQSHYNEVKGLRTDEGDGVYEKNSNQIKQHTLPSTDRPIQQLT